MNAADDFFDEQAADYFSGDSGMRSFHEVSARQLEAALAGDVLCVGGLWAAATMEPSTGFIIADVSRAMLQQWKDSGWAVIQADGRNLPFDSESFDHVVLPLVLHHVAGESVARARDQARRVLSEVERVLRPTGQVWISEFCVSLAVYALEALAAPITRRVLALGRIPLVVMHSRSFYQSALAQVGFEGLKINAVDSKRAKPWDIVTPVIGVPWLKVPRALYPLTPTLLHARKPGT